MNFSLQLGKFSLEFGQQAKGMSPAQWLRGEENTPGGAAMQSALEQSSWVYACVSLLSENVSAIPFRFLKGGQDDEEEIEGGALAELFEMPHPQLDRFSFWELIVSWLMLRGEAFVVPLDKEGAAMGSGRRLKPAQLVVLSPDRFRHQVQDNRLALWAYTGAGVETPLGTAVFLPEEVIHIKLTNPYDFWRGLSPLEVAMLAASSDYASAQFEKGLMLNNADTGVIVTTEQQLSEEQRLSVQKALEERKRKAGTADRPLFLFGGAKVEKPAISSADMQFLENRKFKRQEICAVFKVPQELLGFTEDANRSVGDAARLNFVENRLSPLCRRIETGLRPLIEKVDAGVRGEFHVQSLPVMQAAQRARWDVAIKAFGVGVPLNEANKLFDLGLPQLPHGDKAYLPFSLQPIGDDGTPEVIEPAPVPAEEGKIAGPLAKALRLLEAPKANSQLPMHECGASSAYAAAIQGSVKRKRRMLRNFFVEQQGRVMAKLEFLADKSLPFADDVKAADGAIIVQRAMEDIFDLLAENEKLLKKFTPLLKGDLMFGGAQIWNDLGLDPAGFSVPPAKAIEFLNKRKNEIEGINKTSFEKLKGSLSEGLSNGDTMAELKDRVKEVYAGATEARAETIAVTETNIAVQSGAFEGMTQAGVERKGWQASNLEGVRPEHLQAEADYMDEGIPLEEPFIVGGEELMHPGDPSGSAGNVINCRCFMFAVLPEKAGTENGKTRKRAEGMLSYDAWLESRGGKLE